MSNNHPLTEVNFNSSNEICVIEASAGTGKTWTIERLYIKALLEHSGLNLENILVVTFTNNAANELKIRIIKQINNTINYLIKFKNNQLTHTEDLFINDLITTRDLNTIKKDIIVLTRAKQSYDRISIFTIHGFCAKIIKDFQSEFNINIPIQITTNHDEVLLRLVKAFYKEKIIDNKIFANDLLKVTRNITRLLDTSFNTDIIEKLLNKLPKNLFKLQHGKSMLNYSNITSQNLSVLLEDLVLNKESIKNSSWSESSQVNVKITCNDIKNINQQRKNYFLKVLLSELILYIINKFDDYRKLENKISYDELIQLVSSSITNNNQLALKIFNLFPVAFIDEFQDTDCSQWEIFKSLYAITSKPRGHLIVVGDPKQSIYRFRGADINTYFTAIKQINNIKYLSENRRSHHNIINFINIIFNPMNQHTNCFLGDGIQYQQIIAKVNQDTLIEIPDCGLLNLLTKQLSMSHQFYNDHVQLVTINNQPGLSKEESIIRALTFEILSLLTLEPKLNEKIAILVCKNSQATIVVEYLKKYGIKAVELKLQNIYRTSTARQLLNILESIKDLNKKNKFNIAISGDIFNFDLSKLLHHEKYQIELEELYQQFYLYKYIYEQQGILSLIYKIIENLSCQENHGLTNRELSNLTQLGELLNKQNKVMHNPYDILIWFKNKIDASEMNKDDDMSEEEEIIRLDNDDEQIVVMTQHKAKGLEFDILFCPFFNNDSSSTSDKDRLPMFASYINNGQLVNELIDDEELAAKLIEKNNSEIHRLNYVALTRAKTRIYIYFTETKKTINHKYHHASATNKLDELFGYIKADSADLTHKIFNYPLFFTNPQHAIKEQFKTILSSVVVYTRNISNEDLSRLNVNNKIKDKTNISMSYLPDLSLLNPSFAKQSYSSLTTNIDSDIEKDYYNSDEAVIVKQEYENDILNLAEIKGAKFGLLFHELCENAPLNSSNTEVILSKYDISSNYVDDYIDFIDKALYYKLGPLNLSISQIDNKIHEMEFNLRIRSNIDIFESISQLLINHYGKEHPFSVASKGLKTIEQGYLKGYIDLFFFANDKFWILDYKTNILDNYENCINNTLSSNEILLSMADNHYYLQYLIYLVAIKRYLQKFINISDSSNILGGVIYYYVRGIYVKDKSLSGGIYYNDNCQSLVAELDKLFL